jgi:hypothetical protein
VIDERFDGRTVNKDLHRFDSVGYGSRAGPRLDGLGGEDNRDAAYIENQFGTLRDANLSLNVK